MNDAFHQDGMQPGFGGKRPGGVTGKGWRPGVSGNPAGKRRGHASLTAALKRGLSREDAEAIVVKLIALAKEGDLRATELIFNRLDSADLETRLAELEEAVYRKV
jgi:hypothetical protein